MTDQEIDELVDCTIKAVSEIKKLHPRNHGKWPDAKGTIMCPKCGNSLHYRMSSYNGHVWGKCETNKCIRWME